MGNLSSGTRVKDLEEVFSRFGVISSLDLKTDYAFVVGGGMSQEFQET